MTCLNDVIICSTIYISADHYSRLIIFPYFPIHRLRHDISLLKRKLVALYNLHASLEIQYFKTEVPVLHSSCITTHFRIKIDCYYTGNWFQGHMKQKYFDMGDIICILHGTNAYSRSSACVTIAPCRMVKQGRTIS